jgi:hypothetical protein
VKCHRATALVLKYRPMFWFLSGKDSESVVLAVAIYGSVGALKWPQHWPTPNYFYTTLNCIDAILYLKSHWSSLRVILLIKYNGTQHDYVWRNGQHWCIVRGRSLVKITRGPPTGFGILLQFLQPKTVGALQNRQHSSFAYVSQFWGNAMKLNLSKQWKYHKKKGETPRLKGKK